MPADTRDVHGQEVKFVAKDDDKSYPDATFLQLTPPPTAPHAAIHVSISIL